MTDIDDAKSAAREGLRRKPGVLDARLPRHLVEVAPPSPHPRAEEVLSTELPDTVSTAMSDCCARHMVTDVLA